VAEARLRAVVQALVDRNPDALADSAPSNSEIDHLKIELDKQCFTLLALFQPVATDATRAQAG
jgi:phosphate uptake regulator